LNYVEKFDLGLFDGKGLFSGTGESFSVDVHPKSDAHGHGAPDAIVVPDAHLLFAGDYRRSGLDLVLSKDGHDHVVRDYFRGESRATLASPDGANLSGKTVVALAGQVDYAQAGGTVAPETIIGQVTKLTGSATAIRNGVSITLNMGDNVHKGDVVQSGSDSSLGITFIDGTVFGLSSNARMVLNEMIYNPTGSNNSSLLTLVQGTISFVAGATAKHGDMKVETPTATMGIRGTAVLVEIDFDIPQPGLAPPVSFQILVEPNGTTGEYVLLDKLTLQPIATVNQPGTQTIVNGQGVVTFIASAQIPPDAQRLINEIFALKFTDVNPKYLGIPPTDTITPQTFLVKLTDGTPLNQLPIFITVFGLEALSAPPPSGGNTRFHLDIPPELVADSNSFIERLETGSTTPATVSGEIRFADINPEDRPTVSAQFDSFIYRDAQQTIVTSSLTLEQLAAITAVKVPLSVIPDPDNTNIGGEIWTYSVPDHALDFLAAGETLILTYMARVDTNYIEYNTVVFKPFAITITGTNDLPTVAGGGSTVIELPGTSNPDTRHAGGEITFADVDLTDRPEVSASFASYIYTSAGGSPLILTADQLTAVGVALTLDPSLTNSNNGSVAWSYDVPDSSFDFLADGETLVLNYTVTVDDGHGGVITVPLTVTVGVDGTNDAPSINVIAQQDLTERTDTNALNATIPVTFTDVDLSDVGHTAHVTHAAASGVASGLLLDETALIALMTPGTVAKTSGSSSGSVNLAFSAASTAFDYLADGEVLTLTYTVVIDDHDGGITPQTFVVTITGTNDAPVIETTGLQTSSGNGSTTVSGLSVSDADASPAEIFTVTTDTADPGSSVTFVTGTSPGTLADINAILNSGIIYDPGAQPPQTDMVTLTVADGSGAADTVNFIFNVAEPPANTPVTLASTSGKDVLFGTGYQDQFVFTANSSQDTIVGFTPGTDDIDLTALSSIVSSATLSSFMTTNVTTQGSDILIALDGADTITLRNLPPGSLQAGDFIVHA
jgi:VCBS repeat-containing protein